MLKEKQEQLFIWMIPLNWLIGIKFIEEDIKDEEIEKENVEQEDPEEQSKGIPCCQWWKIK